MTWQLSLALAVTIPALLITIIAIPYFLHRRYRRKKEVIGIYSEGPEHIESKWCKCAACEWEREFATEGID